MQRFCIRPPWYRAGAALQAARYAAPTRLSAPKEPMTGAPVMATQHSGGGAPTALPGAGGAAPRARAVRRTRDGGGARMARRRAAALLRPAIR